jgi:Zn-dependent protease
MLFLNLFSNGPIYIIYFIIALIVAITIHEFSHAWMSNRLGDPSPKLMGRLTLNPLAHLDPVGTIFLFLVGFGWGKPVPFNPNYFKREKLDTVLVALAGPISNIITAIIFSLPLRILLLSGIHNLNNFWFLPLFDLIIIINLTLAAFNLLPIPPLDGSKLYYLFLDRETAFRLESIGPILLIGILLISGFSSNFLIHSIDYIINLFLHIAPLSNPFTL